MAVNNRNLRVTELDFDNIKNNLKTFFKGQSQFKDYDFEGSGLNILLDTLAYNTHYLAFNANMVANEMFLDSASLRSSVVSHAKTLGYDVSSPRAPRALINVILSTDANYKTMPAGTSFSTTIDGTNYRFVTVRDTTSVNSGGNITFNNVVVFEGTYITSKYIVDTSDIDQKFILTDPRADTSTLTVKVQNSTTDATTRFFQQATDITQVTRNSNVYFIQEISAGKFEVYFGDGIISKSVSDGNIIQLEYVVTNKGESNGANNFSSPSSIDGVTNITVTTVSAAVGGAEAESIQSIKLNAPLDYASQGRAVTTKDYEVFVRKLYRNTQAISVWGGEDGSYDPATGVSSTPEYGKVFISIKSSTGVNLTSLQKSNLVAALTPYKVVSIIPVIVDAEITSLILDINIIFNTNITNSTNDEISTKVYNTVSKYSNSFLETFNAPFRHSRLLGLIDNTDNSILNSVATVTLAKYITPSLSTLTDYKINFNNTFYNPHSGHNASAGGIITSTGFYLNNVTTIEYFFDDDGFGNLRLYYISSNTKTYINNTVGVVDYINGLININKIIITGVAGVNNKFSRRIRIMAIPNSYDISPVRNQILEIDILNTTIRANGDLTTSTGVGYSTTTTNTGITTTTVTNPSSNPTTTVSTASSSSSSSTSSSSSSSSSGY